MQGQRLWLEIGVFFTPWSTQDNDLIKPGEDGLGRERGQNSIFIPKDTWEWTDNPGAAGELHCRGSVLMEISPLQAYLEKNESFANCLKCSQ